MLKKMTIVLGMAVAVAGTTTVSSFVFAPEAQAFGFKSVKKFGKKVGRKAKKGGKAIGRKAKKGGKRVGRTARKGGKAAGRYAKKYGKWTAIELKKELVRLTVVCKGKPACISKIKLYQSYMIQLRAKVTMYRLPVKYRRTLASFYPNLKNLNGYRFGYSRRQPPNNATTDCNKTYYNDRKFVARLRKGELSSQRDFIWLLHEIQHYDQCKRVGGRDRFALMWFRDLGKAVISGGIKKIHDNMPMEKDAAKQSKKLCLKWNSCKA